MKNRIKFAVTAVCLAGIAFASTDKAYSASIVNSAISDSATITFEKAEEAAIAKAGGGTVKEIELDYERGILVYEVEVIFDGVEHDVYINAQTGEIVRYKTENLLNSTAGRAGSDAAGKTTIRQTSSKPEKPQNKPQSKQIKEDAAQISYEEAKKIALKRVGGGTVKEIDLENEKGRLIYEVEVRYNGLEYDIELDAMTGEVIKFKIDD